MTNTCTQASEWVIYSQDEEHLAFHYQNFLSSLNISSNTRNEDRWKESMSKEAAAQAKVGVDIGTLWKAFSEDLKLLLPKVVPNFIKDAEVVEGDGGPGTVFLFSFSTDASTVRFQKEKIVDFDETLHQIGLEVIEGGPLNHGFTLYKTVFRLTKTGEQETLIDVKVVYETEIAEPHMPSGTVKKVLVFVGCLESFLLNGNAS
ncbi:Bet v I/Major latex protein [Dillenia turbinata]|uniref:Bet v I/Major latex protein n=1 Tax=Dillenia turbinata TaxID=194707 RepID=A0AAN8VQQ0_9MAGN